MADTTNLSLESALDATSSRRSNPMAQALDLIQDILKGSRVRTVRIRLGDKVLREIPIEAAALTAVIIAVAAVVITQLHIDVVRDDTAK